MRLRLFYELPDGSTKDCAANRMGAKVFTQIQKLHRSTKAVKYYIVRDDIKMIAAYIGSSGRLIKNERIRTFLA